jgi:hypothetical protein
MARQEGRCWSCGAVWRTADAVTGHAPAPVAQPVLAGRITVLASSDGDRWTNEGGRDRPEPATPSLAGATRS